MSKLFKSILFLLNASERKWTLVIIVITFIMTLLETIGLVSIVPFISILLNPDLVETNIILNRSYQILKNYGLENNEQFILIIGFLVFIFLIFSLLFKSLTIYIQLRFVYQVESSISKRLLERYLSQPYVWFLNHNSTDLGKNILSETSLLVGSGLHPIIDIITKIMLSIILVGLLIITDSVYALLFGFLLFGLFVIIYNLIIKNLKKIGNERSLSNHLRHRFVAKIFDAIKHVKLAGLEKNFIKQFSTHAENFSLSTSSSQILGILPRYILEILTFGGIVLAILILLTQEKDIKNILPILSLYIIVSYRLIPALHSIYVSFTKLAFAQNSIKVLTDDIKKIKPLSITEDKSTLSIDRTISLKDVYFSYIDLKQIGVKNININIPAKMITAIVGPTGSGKTTLIDIILGLIVPDKGVLAVDGQVIEKQNIRTWQSLIGYVPQNIYLSDDTFSANIAFGVNPKDINQEDVVAASKISNLHEFITNEFPEKYNTFIGERGIRLSGGERQRIGIARALYHKPKVLILDESTNALDSVTEKTVINSISNLLDKDITIILITHHLRLVKSCEMIFYIEKGEIKSKGTFQELIRSNKNFAALVENSK